MILILFILGLIIGSFVGALSYRLPRNIPISQGRSICPKCKNIISWHDNIPLLSYLILRGKCRNCKKDISTRYPLIEFSTAMGFFLIGLIIQSGNFLDLGYYLLVFSILVLVFVVDFEEQIIPDEATFFGIGIGILYLLLIHSEKLFQNILIGFSLSTFLLLINLITNGKGMGLGDVKFAIFGGIFWGFPQGLVWMFLSFLVGGAFGSVLLLAGKAKLKQKIAFGPFLVIGFLINLFFGNYILVNWLGSVIK